MPHFVILGKWTEQGIRNVKESPKRADAAKALVQSLGGKIDVWYTMGRYDIVALAEAPNEETALQVALQLGAQGNIRTETLQAWSVDEATRVIAKVK